MVPVRLSAAPGLALLFLSVSACWAQESTPEQAPRPLIFTFGQSFSHDSNVLRLGEGVAVPGSFGGVGRGDWFSRTYGGVSYTNQIGTQSVTLGANIDLRRYHQYTGLNRTTYDLSAGWKGDLDRAWFASLGVGLGAYATDFYNQTGLVSNLSRNLSFNGRLGYRLTPTWSGFAAFDVSRRTQSAAALQSSNLNQQGVEVGARFEPGSGIDMELVARRRSTDFPNLQTTDALGQALPGQFDSSYRSDQLLFRVNYQPSGLSQWSAQVGYSNARYNVLKQRDSGGMILGLNYRYNLSDSFQWGARLAHEYLTDQLAFSAPVGSTRIGLDANWRITGRIALNGSFDLTRRRFDSDAGVVLGTSALDSDRLQTITLGASYDLFRTVRLTASLGRSTRNANVVNIPYSGTTANIGIDVRLD